MPSTRQAQQTDRETGLQRVWTALLEASRLTRAMQPRSETTTYKLDRNGALQPVYLVAVGAVPGAVAIALAWLTGEPDSLYYQ